MLSEGHLLISTGFGERILEGELRFPDHHLANAAWFDQRPVAGDGTQEQVKGTGGGLPCLLTRRECGTGDYSGEDHQEHEDARRYD